MALIDGLIAYYPLDGDSLEASGAGPNGADTAVTYSAAKIAQGAETLIVTSGIDLGAGVALGATFTIDFWLKPKASPNHQGARTQYGEILGQNAQNGLFLEQTGAGPLYLELWVSNVLRISHTITPGAEYWVALLFDGTTARLYVDNVEVGSWVGAIAWTVTALLATDGALSNSCAALIDEVGFWDVAHTSGERAERYDGGAVFAYPFVVTPPTLTSVTPATGAETGGTAITLTGTDFVDGATVTVGGAAADDVVFVDAAEITATTPAGAVGLADVVVTNPDTQSDTLAGGFEYTPAPAEPLSREAGAMLQLLPPGKLWHLDTTSDLRKVFQAMADEFTRVRLRGVDLIEESDPRTATETLDEWERMLGLPDDLIVTIPATTNGRRVAIAAKLVSRGGQSPAFFGTLVAACGWTLDSITLFANSVLRVGFRVDDRVYGEAYAYSIQFNLSEDPGDKLTTTELEAILRRATHSHIDVIFNYL